MDQDNSDILEVRTAIFSKNNIILLAIIFTPILGGLMLFYNLRKLGLIGPKNILFLLCYLVLSFMLILIFNVVYTTYLGGVISNWVDSNYLNLRYSSMTFKIAFKTLINVIAIDFLWSVFFGKDFKYPSKDITIPIVVGIVVLAITFWWF